MKAQLMKVAAIVIPLLVLFAILDFARLTKWILYPVSTAKQVFSKDNAG